MADEASKPHGGRVYWHEVLQKLTDQPGMVVYRSTIAEDLNLTQEQVSAVIARLKNANDNPISKEIEIVIPGQAWRYIPSTRVRTAARAVHKPLPPTRSITEPKKRGRKVNRTPLTDSIRRYFRDNPSRIIYAPELQEMMSTDDEQLDIQQIRVGVTNAQQHDLKFREELVTISPGRAWRYDPPDAPPLNPNTEYVPERASAAVAVTAPVTPVNDAPTPIKTGDDDSLLLLEKVGETDDGSLIVRDGDKKLFRLTRI